MASFFFSHRAPVAAFVSLVVGLLSGCAEHQDNVATDDATSEAEVEVAPVLVIADAQAANAAVVSADRIELPAALSVRYPAMPKGTIFVGPRASVAAANSKNPDGFLRRVESSRVEGGTVVIMTTNATLTDAIVNGSIKASSSGGNSAIDNGGELRSGRDVGAINVDLKDQAAFDNVDEIDNGDGTKTTFTESLVLQSAHLTARPNVDIDLRIDGGKVSRFVAKVEGQLDTSITAHAEVSASGPVNANVAAALHEKKHTVEKVIYKSKRIPLPTFSVGRVPLSTAVELTVTLKCEVAFGGPISANAGVDTKSYVRLAAVQSGGTWAPPVKSDFDVRPTFSIDRGSADSDAHCSLETDAELSAYGTSGIVMTVAPYVDFGITRSAPVAGPSGNEAYRTGNLVWTAAAGATGSMRGQAGVFGLAAVDLPLASWKSSHDLTGAVP